MKKKISTILIITLFLGMIGAQIGFDIVFRKVEYIPYDIGPELRSRDVNSLKPTKASLPMSSAETQTSAYYQIGDIVEWYTLDDYNPDVPDGYFITQFELRAIGSVAEIWVQTDLSFPSNDPRDTPVITDDHVELALTNFESNIYPTICDYFGTPEFHDGINAELDGGYYEESGRNVILISNIRDQSYYDDKYPYFIVGFYWGVFERAFDRNIISIDCYNWDSYNKTYLATIAHEYQHLVHDDYLPEDDLFMNEGCSMYSEPLCGYGYSMGDIQAFLATPDNSLTEWGDQGGINILADYGQALLWTVYLSDRFGNDFLSNFFQTEGGIAGLNSLLGSFGESFNSVFHDWRIANLIHTDDIGGGIYNYDSIDLSALDPTWTRVYEVRRPFFEDKLGTDFGVTTSYLNDKTTVSKLPSYGTDYIKLSNIMERFNPQFTFNGDDYCEFRDWNLVDQDGDGNLEWYSTMAGPEKDILLSTEIDLSSYSINPVLSFDTYYDIEEAWDFGFVQVSTNNGITWTSLENAYTSDVIDPDGYPAIYDNLPGLSGSSGGWINIDFDLSAYAGSTILIGFRYMTDWATENLGWYIDNVAIDGVIIDNGDDITTFIGPEPEETDFEVTLIGVDVVGENIAYTQIVTLELDDLTEETLASINLNDFVSTPDGYVLLAVSTNNGMTDYRFSVQRG
jgi:hypothetical protein